MLHKRYLQLFCATFISLCVFDNVSIHIPNNTQQSSLNVSNVAYAKRSGGRSRGGSFKSNSSSSSSSSSSSKRNRRDYDYYSTTDTVIVTNDGDLSGSYLPNIFNLLMLLIIFGGSVAMVSRILQSSKVISNNQELTNEIIAITKLQVALMAENSNVQSQLSELSSLNIDTNNRQGRLQLLQESALALLRE